MTWRQSAFSTLAAAFFALLPAAPLTATTPAESVFRFHLLVEPHSLDPQATSANSGNYIFNSIYRGLFRYEAQKGLIYEGAEHCERQTLRLTCFLRPGHRWSRGPRVTAKDYVTAFRHLIDPNRRSPQVELLFTLKNARAIWAEKLPIDKLGVTAVSTYAVQFDFAEEDSEFEFKLNNPALSPWPPSGILERADSPNMDFSGPYKIARWEPNHAIRLTANLNYGMSQSPQRPDVESHVIEDDSTALELFESGRLDLLRRLPTSEIPRFKNRPEFRQLEVARFDYIGFGPQLRNEPELRQALGESLDYQGFLKLFDSKGPPGCTGLGRRVDHEVCLSFDPQAAKRRVGGLKNIPKLVYKYSLMGGDDVALTSQWLQGQWKKNLNLAVELDPVEQGGYLKNLRVNPPPIFRKGVSLDRPTCLAALELFTSESPENYIQFHEPKFDQLIHDLRATQKPDQRRALCRKGAEMLMQSHRLIPLGEYYFTMLANDRFTGWSLNELNQLDLTNLRARAQDSSPKP